MLKRALESAKDFLGCCVLDLSGEILIQNNDRTQLLTLTQAEHNEINLGVAQLRRKFPMLNISKKDSLAETRISLFAYQTLTHREKLLEELQAGLSAFVDRIILEDHLRVGMNIFGSFSDGKEMKRYRMLNKREQVDYVITESKPMGISDKLFSQRTKRAILVGLMLLLILDILYEGLIAGNGFRLTNIFEVFKSQPTVRTIEGIDPKDVV